MGHYEYQHRRCMRLAREFVLADNFFQGAFGGSFLNHQYLICACAPEYPDAETAAAKPSIAMLEKDAAGHYLPRLEGGGRRAGLGARRAAEVCAERQHHAGQLLRRRQVLRREHHAARLSTERQRAGGRRRCRLPIRRSARIPPPCRRRTQPTIGDALERQAHRLAGTPVRGTRRCADGRQPPRKPRRSIYAPERPAAIPISSRITSRSTTTRDFDPRLARHERAAHLKDYDALVADIAAGRLPPVVFYKPQGNLNQHPGYASIADGDAHIAELVAKLRAGPQWSNMVIVITYDEFGGAWDHVAPPQGDLLGPRCAHTGADHFAVRQERRGRSHAVRHGIDPAPLDHAPLRSRRPAGHRRRDRALAEHGAAADGRSDQRARSAPQLESRR